MRRTRNNNTYGSLLNISLSIAKLFLIVGLLSIVLIQQNKVTYDGVRPKVEAMLTVTWEDKHPADVDTWVRCPTGETIWYRNMRECFVSLERDNLGTIGNVTYINNMPVYDDSRQELVVFRKLSDGDYFVSVHLFSNPYMLNKTDLNPVQVKIELNTLNPVVKLHFSGKVNLTRITEEISVLQFTVSNGQIVSVRVDNPVSLTKGLMESTFRRPGAPPSDKQ